MANIKVKKCNKYFNQFVFLCREAFMYIDLGNMGNVIMNSFCTGYACFLEQYLFIVIAAYMKSSL